MPRLSRPVSRRARVAAALATALLAAACGARESQPAAPTPSTAVGDTLTVAVATTVRALRAGEPRDRVTFVGGDGQLTVEWEVRSGPCMLATAEARRSGAELVVRVRRGGDPVALCVAGEVVYRYVLRVDGLSAGTLRVRLLEEPVEQAAREVGSATVVVRPPGA
jgi:hypothetical protein